MLYIVSLPLFLSLPPPLSTSGSLSQNAVLDDHCLQMVELESEVTAKQAQLQALALEHAALSAKARALDQLVTSAGGWQCSGAVLCMGG